MKRVCAFSLASCAALWLLTGVASAQGGGSFDFGFAESPEQTAPDLVDPGLLEIDCIENDGPRWPAGSLADQTGDPGATTQGTYFCTITQNDPCTGAVPIPNPEPPPNEILGPCTGGTRGGQGWQMSFSATGCNAVILGVTATQTDIAPGTVEDCEKGPGGEGGFDNTELTIGLKSTPPFVGEPNAGAVHAIVLHLKKGTTLDPSGINFKPATGPEQNPVTVCRFLVECTNPAGTGQTCDLTLAFVDGLEGSGQPVDNKVTQEGQSEVPTLNSEVIQKTAMGQVDPEDCDDAIDNDQDGDTDCDDSDCDDDPACVVPPEAPCDDNIDNDEDGVTDCADSDCSADPACIAPGADFIRGDPNNDRKNNLADAVWILNGAFRNPPHVPAACEDATDANGDGFVDAIVDASYIITYQFGGTGMPPPPPPFPGCGAAPTPSGLNCPPGSTVCN